MQKREVVNMLLALGVATGGVGVFAYALRDAMANTEGIRRAAIEETVIHIGKPGPGNCSVDIRLTTWEAMNRMGVYRWVAACEDAARVAADAAK